MQKIIVGIFAHPDDEAFGPAGTLLKLKDEGYDIHLVLLTNGEAGTNPDQVSDLGVIRLEEWKKAADILGTSSTHTLHYPDGGLENISHEELDSKTQPIIKKILTEYGTVEISFMTFEPTGLTGHLDHIAASELTTRMVKEFRANEVWYFCLDSTQAPLDGTTYYEPRAREDSYITDRIDVAPYLAKIFMMIDAHTSQRADGEKRKALGNERLSVECFRVER